MIKELLSPGECACCRECCVFEAGEAFALPVITDRVRDICRREFPLVRFAERPGGGYMFDIRSYADENGLCPCPVLTPKGCALGDDKPFECSIFPLRVCSDGDYAYIVLDSACHVMESKDTNVIKEYLRGGKGERIVKEAAETGCIRPFPCDRSIILYKGKTEHENNQAKL
ncbi:MAG: hypothetical protein II714_06160 [Oscillospiraceae bacterium]|nr:hypothetical protein [Oscillospiraceae bacterium]